MTTRAKRDAVLRALGEPETEAPQEYDDSVYAYGDMTALEYPGMRLLLVNGMRRRGPFRVIDIDISQAVWTVTPGLHVGMDAKEAQRRLPGLKKITDVRRPGQKLLGYSFDVANTPVGGRLFLRLEKGKVSQITITSDVE